MRFDKLTLSKLILSVNLLFLGLCVFEFMERIYFLLMIALIFSLIFNMFSLSLKFKKLNRSFYLFLTILALFCVSLKIGISSVSDLLLIALYICIILFYLFAAYVTRSYAILVFSATFGALLYIWFYNFLRVVWENADSMLLILFSISAIAMLISVFEQKFIDRRSLKF